MSNTSKQLTAVEWLINEINKTNPEVTWALRQECSKALAMEKEQRKKITISSSIEEIARKATDTWADSDRYLRRIKADLESYYQGYKDALNFYNSLYGKEEKQ